MPKSSSSRSGRVATPNASDLALPRIDDSPVGLLRSLSEIDRRRYAPSVPSSRLLTPYVPAKTLSGRPARLTAVPAKQYATKFKPPAQRSSWQAVGFQIPSRVGVCVRRGIRREVLHALKIAGRRGLSGGRRSEFSGIRC